MIIFKSDSFFLTFFSQHLLRWNFLKSTRKTQKHGFSASGTQSNVRYNILSTTSLSATDYTQIRQAFLICLLATKLRELHTVSVTFTFYLHSTKKRLNRNHFTVFFLLGRALLIPAKYNNRFFYHSHFFEERIDFCNLSVATDFDFT